jgi:hypothetical protein
LESAKPIYQSEMALVSECMPWCAQIVLDTADIVRDRDVTPTVSRVLIFDAQMTLELKMFENEGAGTTRRTFLGAASAAAVAWPAATPVIAKSPSTESPR